MQEKFLKQVADYYINSGKSMAKTTFVFPNRRSAMFMRDYMQKAIEADTTEERKPRFMPRMVSITYFIQQFDKSALATQTELAFILYRTYCRIVKNPDFIPDFDRFYFWASIILKDFDEVDSYLVEHRELYKNLKNLKEMRSNYLNEEQLAVIRYLWGEQYAQQPEEGFWQHFETSDDDQSASAKFLYLWQIMGQLYVEFIKELDSQPTPLAYSGLQSRRACKAIKGMTADDFGGRKFVFVGFSVLSTSRAVIFNRLKELGIAEFFWDIASPFISGAKPNDSSARFILPLAKRFKMPDDFTLEPINQMPDIEIISVPSNFGQTKVASQILNDWVDEWKKTSPDHKITDDTLINTAVVLADEHLLTPMLYSVPDDITDINVTMGISYANTPFAALMSAIISLHLRARKRHGVFYYYYQDIIDVLSHSHISIIAADEARALKDKLLTQHIFTVSADEIVREYPALAFIFTQIDDDRDIAQVRGYIDRLVSTLQSRLKALMNPGDDRKYYELDILNGYAEKVDELCSLIQKHNIVLHERTFLMIIERALNMMQVNFSGEPLKGLQIMGIMDTRTLDFSNLIILSMNERTFPRRSFNPSFIPMSLRSGFGMPVQEHEESSYAYQFYRMISRADRVRLLYDSRTGGLSSGEMSRFLSQLLHLNKDIPIVSRAVVFRAEADEAKMVTIDKTPLVIEELRRFRPGGDLRLSASALKTYISCPLKFYLQYVKKLRVNDDTIDYIDAASYGTVIHNVVQQLYDAHKDQVINEHVLDVMAAENIELYTLRILNEKYYKSRYTDALDRIPGEGQIVAKIIAKYVRTMLRYEKALTPYTFVGAEVGEHVTQEWKINDKYTLNFTMSIDRIDSFRDPVTSENVLRFIDYKTGSDALTASNLDRIFTSHDCGGIFQLLLYSYAYASPSVVGFEGRIKPIIYKFVSMPQNGIEDLRYSRKPIQDYREVDGFYEKLEELIDHIFEEDNAYPFCQTDDDQHCLYCPFSQLCGRFPEEKKRN